jgi:hypothetical protein
LSSGSDVFNVFMIRMPASFITAFISCFFVMLPCHIHICNMGFLTAQC